MITTAKRTRRAVKAAAAFIGTFVLMLFVSCTQPGSGTASTLPDVTEVDLLSAFGLTRGGIIASAVAEKIRDEAAGGIAGLTFSERKIVSYDDEAGTFTVHVKGTKLFLKKRTGRKI